MNCDSNGVDIGSIRSILFNEEHRRRCSSLHLRGTGDNRADVLDMATVYVIEKLAYKAKLEERERNAIVRGVENYRTLAITLTCFEYHVFREIAQQRTERVLPHTCWLIAME